MMIVMVMVILLVDAHPGQVCIFTCSQHRLISIVIVSIFHLRAVSFSVLSRSLFKLSILASTLLYIWLWILGGVTLLLTLRMLVKNVVNVYFRFSLRLVFTSFTRFKY